MIEIRHSKEPEALAQAKRDLKCTPDAAYCYRELRSDVKLAIREQLVIDQGSICAYCMRRISACEEKTKATIEHFIPQKRDGDDEGSLDYNNMYAVCDETKKGLGSEIGCDKSRGNRPLRINPARQSDIDTIYYKADGKICSSDPDINKDLDLVLNLNSEERLLPKSRKRVWETIESDLRKLHCAKPNGNKSIIHKLERRIQSLESFRTEKPEFAGLLIWRYKKHVKKLKNKISAR